MEEGFQNLNRGDALPDTTVVLGDIESKRAHRTASKLRKRLRRLEPIAADSLSGGGITHTQRLIEAAVRVWELKRGLRH